MRLFSCVLLSIFCLAPYSAFPSDSPVTAADVRKAIERSLPFIEKEGVAWMDERKCIGCHHVSFMIWAHNDARAKGFNVDAKKIDAWSDWAAEQSLNARAFYRLTQKSIDSLSPPKTPDAKDAAGDPKVAPDPKIALPPKDAPPAEILEKLKPLIDKPFVTEEEFHAALNAWLKPDEFAAHKAVLTRVGTQARKGGQNYGEANDGAGLDAICHLLLGIGKETAKEKEFLAATPYVLGRWQEGDGSWAAAGQFPGQNRPRPESNLVTTGWAVLGLDEKIPIPVENIRKQDEAAMKMLDRALLKVKGMKPGKSTESTVVAMLVEQKFGSKDRAAALREELLKQQNKDGGWAWLTDAPDAEKPAPSDAFATGQVLYALSYFALSVDDPAVQRALRFLIDTQGEGGSWLVPGSTMSVPTTAPARYKRLEKVYTYWGSAWAAIGMLRVLPEK